MTQTLYNWMTDFRYEDSARGDLARDMKREKIYRIYNLKRKGFREYFTMRTNAYNEAIITFEKCYQQYLGVVGIFAEDPKKTKITQLIKCFGEPIGHIRGTPVLRAIKRLDWSGGSSFMIKN